MEFTGTIVESMHTQLLSLFNHITLTPHEKQHYRPPDSVSDDFVAFGDVS